MNEETFRLTGKSYSHLMEALKELIKDFSIEEIILFGSRALGNYKQDSDIDLAFKEKNLSHKDIDYFLYF